MKDFDEALRLNPKYAPALNNRGNVWHDKGDYDQAIADYDAALRVEPKSARTFYNRGNSLAAKGDYDRAIGDYNTAVGLNPRYAVAFKKRGDAWRAKGENDRALADYDTALALNPRFPDASTNRGLMRFQRAQFALAAEDFASAMQWSPTAYRALWLFLSKERSGTGGAQELLRNGEAAWKAAWPWPIISFYLNQSSADEVRAASARAEPEGKKQRCEATFFLGQWHVVQKQVQEAEQLFQAARDECVKSSWEHEAAEAELKRLSK
jgi:lipoprotein NlpI